MESENIINKIELKLGDTTISLTIEQAKKLKEALGELFGKEIVKEVTHHHDHFPYYWQWQYPSGTWHNQQTFGQSLPLKYAIQQTSGDVRAEYIQNAETLSLKMA